MALSESFVPASMERYNSTDGSRDSQQSASQMRSARRTSHRRQVPKRFRELGVCLQIDLSHMPRKEHTDGVQRGTLICRALSTGGCNGVCVLRVATIVSLRDNSKVCATDGT